MQYSSHTVQEQKDLSMEASMVDATTSGSTGQKQDRRRSRRSSGLNSWTNYLYIAPILLFVLGITYFSIFYTMYVSTLKWNGLSPNSLFVGLQHYVTIIQDPIFYITLRNTIVFAVLTIGIQMLLGLFLALLLKTRVVVKEIYKTIFFLPVVLAPSVISFVFRRMLDANSGEVNQFLTAIGLPFLAQSWLADPNFALFSLIAINVWQWTGFSFVMYFSALTLIDESLYEAARIDGASSWRIIWNITFPMLRPTNFSLIILGFIGALKSFDIVWLTTGGGPGRATEFLSTYIYKKAILEYDAGYSAALSVALLLVALLVTFIQLRSYQGKGANHV